jgi:hypothetical protein
MVNRNEGLVGSTDEPLEPLRARVLSENDQT